MKRLLIPMLMFSAIFAILPASAAGNGVDDLRGRWDITAYVYGSENSPLALTVYVNDLAPDPDEANAYLAGGCMRSPSSGASAPLSLRAVDHLDGTYAVTLWSTIVPESGASFVVRFDGAVEVSGEGVPDDIASGSTRSDFSEGTWSGIHHDRRRTKCPPVDLSVLFFSGDVYAVRNVGPEPDSEQIIFEGYTQIVSNGMRVELPNGEIVIAEPFSDIFSPHIDFVSAFRYLASLEGAPIAGQPYTFTLLDALGRPSPGAESVDIWFGCAQSAPANLNAVYSIEQSVALSWNAAPAAPGFDPANGIGFYQIAVFDDQSASPSQYGAAGMAVTTHVIPWASFVPGSPGIPDGTDFGDALNNFVAGAYRIDVIAFSVADPADPGAGLECQIRDTSESLRMEKSGSSITITSIP